MSEAPDLGMLAVMSDALAGGTTTSSVTLAEHLREVDPGPHLDWWHIGAMVEACQAVLDGEIEKLVVMAPPRSWKSRIIAQGVPSCRFRNHPDSKIYLSCADDELLRYHSGAARAKSVAGGVELKTDSRSLHLWQTIQSGAFRAVTVAGGPLGMAWDLGVTDDPFRSYSDAQSVVMQKKVWNWRRNDWSTRAQMSPWNAVACEIMVNQRLSTGDLWGRMEKWLEEFGLEEWTVLCLQGYRERTSVSYPNCCTVIDDPRAPGEPLSDSPMVMSEIEKRRRTNPGLHADVDQQRPTEDAGGGVFCRSWFRVVGAGLADLPTLEAVATLAKDGIIAAPSRRARGWDFNAGGSDKTASALGSVAGDFFLWEDAREYSPEPAALERLVIDTAQDDGNGVEIVLPNEVAVGKVFSDRLAVELRRRGFTVHVVNQREPKRSRSLGHAGKAAALCHSCQKFIVPEDAAEMFSTRGLCKCESPGGDGYGGVMMLAGPWNEMAAGRLHAFTGEPGGSDDLIDAMAVVFNVLVGGVSTEWFVGGTDGQADKGAEVTEDARAEGVRAFMASNM